MGTYFTFRWKALLDMYRKIFPLQKKSKHHHQNKRMNPKQPIKRLLTKYIFNS